MISLLLFPAFSLWNKKNFFISLSSLFQSQTFLMPMTLFRNVLKNYNALDIKQDLVKYICPFPLHWVRRNRKKKEAKGHITIFYAVKNRCVPGQHKYWSILLTPACYSALCSYAPYKMRVWGYTYAHTVTESIASHSS